MASTSFHHCLTETALFDLLNPNSLRLSRELFEDIGGGQSEAPRWDIDGIGIDD